MIEEFDIEIIPMKLVRGKSLVQAIVEEDPRLVSQQYVLNDTERDDWYKDIMKFLVIEHCPEQLNRLQRRALKVKSKLYDQEWPFVQKRLGRDIS